MQNYTIRVIRTLRYVTTSMPEVSSLFRSYSPLYLWSCRNDAPANPIGSTNRIVASKNKETRGQFSTTCFLVFYCSSFLGNSFFFALNAGLSIMLRPMVTNM